MIKNPSASANIPDGSITNIKLANGTISSAKLDASLNALISAGGGGGLTENSVSSFHIISGSILTTDISNHAITFDKLAVDSVGNTRIINGAVTHAKLSSDCVQSHNIVDGSILGTDICGNTIQGSNIAEGTITSYNIANGTILGTDISGATIQGSNIAVGTITSSNILNGTILGTDISGATITGSNIADETITNNNIADATIELKKLVSGLQYIIGNTYTGIFEITCNDNVNVDFYYEVNAEKIYLFQNQELNGGGDKTFLSYHGLPTDFATTIFTLASDVGIDSYSLTYATPTNGITGHSQAGAGRIEFNILRNSQHYLELNIVIDI